MKNLADEPVKDKKPGLKDLKVTKQWKSESSKRPGKDPSAMNFHALTGPKKKASVFFNDDMTKPQTSKVNFAHTGTFSTSHTSPPIRKATVEDKTVGDVKQTTKKVSVIGTTTTSKR